MTMITLTAVISNGMQETTLLPLELTDLVIETAALEEAKTAPGLKATACYLLSLPVPDVPARKGLQILQVRRIEINLRSHDQGWVIWTKQENDGPKDAKTSLRGLEGLGHELVRILKPGDRIAVIALAEQWGWKKHVESGSIDIYYSV
ncbi:hypothetical protein BDP27DRAFT_1361345 [Rhodocollybia butyracea]|uniref:Uncharacterized protein n=1 Tax=Rhodocollybia butyracea TaxID=206335 RepID=A0A9P5Q1Z0_9AGAR|nr:hypothetical protein BDP27DRAFT_1361345 [Rhodocollybia butyracea]